MKLASSTPTTSVRQSMRSRMACVSVAAAPLDDEPRERRLELAQPCELDLTASRHRVVDERVEHRRLLAQDLGQRKHVVRRARMDGEQRRYAHENQQIARLDAE